MRLGDVRDPSTLPNDLVFDVVTGTPPYLPLGTATAPRRDQQPGCHLELRGGVEDYVDTAARALAPRGRFVLCHSAGKGVERAARAAGLAVIARRDVVPRAGKRPLFGVYALGREASATSPSSALVVRDSAGRWTDDFRAVRAAMGMPVNA